MSIDGQSDPRLYFAGEQIIQVVPFEHEGLILDIGGGGEGIIGRLKGDRVISIDLQREELEEAPPGPLKLVMDARAMAFLDESFETATAFFALMFVKSHDLNSVFREAFRILKPGGHFRVWDAMIPPRGNNPQEVFVIRLNISLPDAHVQTGFGVRWAGREQSPAHFENLAAKAGFQVAECHECGQTFRMVLKKPL